MSTRLLTETANYNEPGSWDRMSRGWPEIRGDAAYAMFVFANCAPSIPYGSYVLISQSGECGASESCLRVQAARLEQIKTDFAAAGSPEPEESRRRRGVASKANKWW